MSKNISNAKRLAWAMYCHSDKETINQIAKLLDYLPQSLQEDIQSLNHFMDEIEETSKNEETM